MELTEGIGFNPCARAHHIPPVYLRFGWAGMHERILAEFQAAGAGTIDHPKERYVTQPVVRVATSDIGVNSRKPDLFHMLIFCAFLRLPQCRLERSSLLVDRQRLIGSIHAGAQFGIVKLPSLIEQGDQAEPIKRDSERTHRVPDPDETDARLVGVRAPEQCRLLPRGVFVLVRLR